MDGSLPQTDAIYRGALSPQPQYVDSAINYSRVAPIGLPEAELDTDERRAASAHHRQSANPKFKTIDAGLSIEQETSTADQCGDSITLRQRQRIFEDVIIQRVKVLQEFFKRSVVKLER